MADLINLNKVRKGRKKAEKEKMASRNRLAFGQSKAQKHQNQSINDKLANHLDKRHLGSRQSASSDYASED